MQIKVCTKCGLEKEATSEYFIRCKSNKDGLRCSCKQCMREYDHNRKENDKRIEYNKAYRGEHREFAKEQQKLYYAENKEQISEKGKLSYIENRENELLQRKKYYYFNKEKENMNNRNYYTQNRTKVNKKQKEYRENNTVVIVAISQRRRARKLLLPCTLTIEQWEKIKLDFNNRCAYCNRKLPLAQEHLIPLIHGGEYTTNNIIPSCQSCNSSKGSREFKDWYKDYKYYSRDRELKILRYLHYNNGIQQLTLTL